MRRAFVIGTALTLAAILVGCAQPTRPPAEGLGDLQTRAELKWQHHLAAASDDVRDAHQKLAEAEDEKQFDQAVDAVIGVLGKKTASEADRRVKDKLVEDVAVKAINQIEQDHREGKSAAEVAPALRKLEGSVTDGRTRKVLKAAGDFAEAGDPDDPKLKAAAREAVAEAGKAIDESGPPPATPPGDPELNELAAEAQSLSEKIEKAVQAGQDTAELMRKFVEVTGLADKRIGQLINSGADGIDKVAGPALGIAKAVGGVAKLAKEWKNMSDLEKVAGIAGTLSSVLSAAQPFLTAAAAQYKVPVMLGLALISEILPKLNLGDFKMPGGLKIGGGGKSGGGKDGRDDKGDGKGGGKDEGKKPGDAKGQGGKPAAKPQPKDVVGAAVAGEYPHGADSSPKDAARQTAQGVQKRLGLNDQQGKALEKAYRDAMEKNPTASPKERMKDLADATTRAVPEAAKKAEGARDQIKDKAEKVRKAAEAEAKKKPDASPEERKKQVASLAAGGDKALEEKILITLQGESGADLGAMSYRAVLLGWSFDAASVRRPLPGAAEE